MQSRAQHAYLALRSLSFLPQHADRPVAVLTGTGLRSPEMAYAVKRLVGPVWPYARSATYPPRSLPGRRHYRHGPAG